MHRQSLAAFAASLFAINSAFAQAQPERLEFRDDVPIEVYLSLLAQVAPPARDGAEAYMAAFKTRCGRAMRTVELRRAFAEGDGNPTLMAMIRASHQRDTAGLQRLAAQVSCPARS
ncbi:MAG: hypothetical protein HZA63_14715 [Rhodocyclales bacterium]|nr:hypothetical protein [Rhodocyclales bacterium]